MSKPQENPFKTSFSTDVKRHRVGIVGSGFSGLCMAIQLKRAGIDDFVVWERATNVGGTWYHNDYPGCQCDVPTSVYSFSFAPNHSWTRTFPLQPEIQKYLASCVEKFCIGKHIKLNCEVDRAVWNDARAVWMIETSDGPCEVDVLVSASGPLNEPNIPDLPGMENFAGDVFHSANWQHDVALEGKKIALVGSGASAIQIGPHLQQVADQLTVLQRTPPWIIPHRDRPVKGWETWALKHVPLFPKLVRSWGWCWRELFVIPFAYAPTFMRPLERMSMRHLRRQVQDPTIRKQLTPEYRLGCKRLLPSNRWLPIFNNANVELVSEAASGFTADSIVSAGGHELPADVVVFATGFNVTDPPITRRVIGKHGNTIAGHWNGSPQAYKGTAIAGFPNLFLLVGPNTGLGHNSLVHIIESQVRYVLQAVKLVDSAAVKTLEVRRDAMDAYNDRLQQQLSKTVWNTGGCKSWYIDKHGRNSTIWPRSTVAFRRMTKKFDKGAYMTTGGKRIIITGAASGIGEATMAALQARGAQVAGVDRNVDGRAELIVGDIADMDSVQAAVDRAIEILGGVDVVINCAGLGEPQSATLPPNDKALHVLDVNAVGAWRVSAAAMPELRRSRGRIINVASGLGYISIPYAPAYCMSKRALMAYSDSLRHELGDQVAVTTIYPGYIKTPIHDAPARHNLSLDGLIPEEQLTDAVSTIVAASLRARPWRDRATTRKSGVIYHLIKRLGGRFSDRIIGRRTKHIEMPVSFHDFDASNAGSKAAKDSISAPELDHVKL